MQLDQLNRRDFITLLGGAAATWPLVARAQQGERMRRVGVLMGVTDDADGQARVKALQQGLHELGWIEAATCASIIAGRAVMRLAFAIYEYAPLSGVAEVDRVLG
jgi:hypothetical protein